MNEPNMKQASITHTVRSNPFDADIHNADSYTQQQVACMYLD
jgi:hypothetical protein